MVRKEKFGKGMLPRIELPKLVEKEPVKDMVVMAFEFMKYQGEVAYETGKRQAIAITSMASTISIGWSAFFIGIVQESWFTSSLGLMLVFCGIFILGYWTPRVVDGVRRGLIDSGSKKFYEKWLPDSANTGSVEKTQ